MRLRNIRRKLEDGQRRYRSNKRRCEDGPNPDKEEEDGSGTTEWINLMKRLRPSTDNISSIKAAMQKTFTWRRSWIAKHSPSLSEIFEEYPHFLDMPTLLDTEFGKMFEGKGDLFLRRWEATIIPKLKAIAIMETGDLASLKDMENQNEDEKCYTMLVVLTHLLPPVAMSRCSVKFALTFLVDFVPAGSSIASLCDDCSSQTNQPQLICVGNLRAAAKQHVIVGKSDRITVPLEEGLTSAVDKLFKLYWVCNLAYPCQLSSVFCFFEHIYDMPLSTSRKAKVLKLSSKVKASQFTA
ncbi:uncharacterized protein LOC125801249 isoform X2 [Astyanax mexicanus]|nr:uncharacterized protein LOC125801249 isoform X2 [Astyanax mexicanus]